MSLFSKRGEKPEVVAEPFQTKEVDKKENWRAFFFTIIKLRTELPENTGEQVKERVWWKKIILACTTKEIQTRIAEGRGEASLGRVKTSN